MYNCHKADLNCVTMPHNEHKKSICTFIKSLRFHINKFHRHGLYRVCSIVFFFFIVIPLLCSGCTGSTGNSPIEKIKLSLKNQPTYSIILDDMKYKGSFFKTYYHKYLVVQPEGSWRTDWLKVPERFYKQNQKFLGMAVLTKKDGKFQTGAAPPGYGFVGDSRYGRWTRDSSGGSFWEFYGKYAFFSNLFGGWYHPVRRSEYRTYNQYRTLNRPFFGSRHEFGSSGEIVKRKRPGFFARRMSRGSAGSGSFASRMRSRIGRSRMGFRGRAGGFGK